MSAAGSCNFRLAQRLGSLCLSRSVEGIGFSKFWVVSSEDHRQVEDLVQRALADCPHWAATRMRREWSSARGAWLGHRPWSFRVRGAVEGISQTCRPFPQNRCVSLDDA